jgi:hypothetical protein
VHVEERIKTLAMDLEETEAKTDCAGEVQQQFNRPTELVLNCESTVELVMLQSPAGKDVSRGHCWDPLPRNG